MAIVLKAIKDIEGNVTALGELTPLDTADVTDGGIKFADGSVQTTAAASEVASVFGRKGAVVAAANDYSAAQVSLDPANIDGVDATNVQTGFEQLSTLIAGSASGLIFMGQIGVNDPDPTPPTESPSHYYIFNDTGTRATGEDIQPGDQLIYNLQTSEWIHLSYMSREFVASQIGFEGTGNTYATGPEVDSALDQLDAALIDTNDRLDALELAPGGVSSFNTRTGAVMPAAGDYTAAQTTFAPAGGITATDVQAAIVEVGAKAIPFFDTNGASKPIALI